MMDQQTKCPICKHDYTDVNEFKRWINLPNELIPKYVKDNQNSFSSKILKIIEIAKPIITKNEKILIFSQWSSFIKIISLKLHEHDIKNVIIDGSCSMNTRKTLLKEFKENNEIRCLLST